MAVVEGNSVAETDYCLDTATGFVTRRRTLAGNGTARGAHDVLSVFTQSGESAGRVGFESSYGGDLQTLPTDADPCTVALPGSDEFGIVHHYQAGALASSAYADASHNPLPFKSYDVTIDKSTGLPSASRDASGLLTNLTYDAMGRITLSASAASNPAGMQGGQTSYQYTSATSPTGLAQVAIQRLDSSGGTLASSTVLFDGFGRVWREQQKMADNSTSTRETLYNASGWKLSVSEMGGALGQRTQYLAYDPFGRPTQVRPPDGSAHDIFMTYFGVRRIDRTVRIATAAGTETSATTTQYNDRQGRLFQVVESSGVSNAAVVTAYRYDVGNHLVRIYTAPTIGGTVVGQMRHFAYDSLGFLRSETQVEKGAAGNGTVTYSNYTSRGQVGRKIDGSNDLSFSYDRAERLVQVQETGTSGRLLKTFTYSAANSVGNQSLGKLASSTRYNYPVLGTTPYNAFVNQAYTYGGREGRVSQRVSSLTFNGATNESFTTGFTYSPLGDIDTISYPQCTFAACAGVAASPRMVQNLYTNGFLTAVPNYAPSISYSSNGMVYQVIHANMMVDTEQRDPVAMRRPLSIGAAGTTSWSSGNYAYDGAGNIKAIGSATFLYDPVSRLVASTQYDLFGTAKVQNYTFDPFGNLTAITGTSGRNVPIDPYTNRLTGAGVAYDAMGQLTAWNGATYEYDAFGQMKHMVNGSQEWLYMYDADDERFWSFQVGGPARFDRFTLRDLAGKVLRTYEATAYNWTGSVAADYVYRNGLLLAGVNSNGPVHYHLDHLGTPRLITDQNGIKVAYHLYYPFGEEATAFNQDTERMKFTGHERDLASLAGTGDDLDYMHARFFSPVTERFTTADKEAASLERPQSWNRYAYCRSNALAYADPSGNTPQAFYLLTGNPFGDLTTHSAVYFQDKDPNNKLDLVFSHGGVADGVMSLSTYLSKEGGETTRAFPLDLNDKQVKQLLDSFLADYKNTSKGYVRTAPPYDPMSNNCVQYACSKVIGAASPIQRGIIDVITVAAGPLPPYKPMLSLQGISLLAQVGLLASAERENQPAGHWNNAIVYFTYNPPVR
ncbi:MAG TPA: RHS repeat-associated core domain-containing protein [Thermoanaerobaculia bacterium]